MLELEGSTSQPYKPSKFETQVPVTHSCVGLCVKYVKPGFGFLLGKCDRSIFRISKINFYKRQAESIVPIFKIHNVIDSSMDRSSCSEHGDLPNIKPAFLMPMIVCCALQRSLVGHQLEPSFSYLSYHLWSA